MLDLVGNPNCWFCHATAKINLCFSGDLEWVDQYSASVQMGSRHFSTDIDLPEVNMQCYVEIQDTVLSSIYG